MLANGVVTCVVLSSDFCPLGLILFGAGSAAGPHLGRTFEEAGIR